MATEEHLSIERRAGKSAGILIFTVIGPITVRTLFDFQNELRGTPSPAVTILDLTGVPYLDSGGMGSVINHYVHCLRNGGKLSVAGVNSRALALFKLTKVDTLIPMYASVEEAEAGV